MLRKLRERIESEKGFTLIELLVVILIIGILAAIALPAFLSQQDKGKDASAKSDARNMVSQVESCFADTRDYRQCVTSAQLGTTGLKVDDNTNTPAAGHVSLTASNADSFDVVAMSTSTSGGANHEYHIVKSNGAGPTRNCSPANEGGCKGGTW